VGRPVSDAQVRKLMEEMSKHGEIGRAARKADMDRKTARKYVKKGKLPSEMTTARPWRTREDPFVEHWSEIEERLRQTPELEAKTLFELLQEKYPGRYEQGQLRTLQRRVRQWRAERGPDKEITLAQKHRPGEAAQTDFTSAAELGVTIADLEPHDGRQLPASRSWKGGGWGHVIVVGKRCERREGRGGDWREASDYRELFEGRQLPPGLLR